MHAILTELLAVENAKFSVIKRHLNRISNHRQGLKVTTSEWKSLYRMRLAAQLSIQSIQSDLSQLKESK